MGARGARHPTDRELHGTGRFHGVVGADHHRSWERRPWRLVRQGDARRGYEPTPQGTPDQDLSLPGAEWPRIPGSNWSLNSVPAWERMTYCIVRIRCRLTGASCCRRRPVSRRCPRHEAESTHCHQRAVARDGAVSWIGARGATHQRRAP